MARTLTVVHLLRQPQNRYLQHLATAPSQAAKAPHHDLSAAEVEAAVRLAEHLLHLQRSQRRSLATAAARYEELADLAGGLAAVGAASAPLPRQARMPGSSQLWACPGEVVSRGARQRFHGAQGCVPVSIMS